MLCQNVISTLSDLNTTLIGCCLALFVEAHYHDSSAIALDVLCMTDKHLLAFLQRDAVDDALTLQTFQTSKDDIPVGRVNHDGYRSDIWFGSNGVKEIHHFRLCIQQTIVHIHVDDQRTVSHLFAGNADSLVILLFLNQSQEFARASHITALTHIDEVYFWRHVEQLQSAEPHGVRLFGRFVRCLTFSQGHIFRDKLIVSTTTASHNVHQTLINHLANLRCHRLRSLVIESHGIGQSCIRIGTNIIRCLASQLAQEGQHLARTKRAVQTHREDGITTDAGQEGIEGLSTECATSQVADGSTQHDGHLTTTLLHGSNRSIDSHLRIQAIENGFY